MVARALTRYGTAETSFAFAREAGIAALAPGDVAVLGARADVARCLRDAIAVRLASWTDDSDSVATDVETGEQTRFVPQPTLVDLGDLPRGADPVLAVEAIQRTGAVPVLLGSADDMISLRGFVPADAAFLLVSPGLPTDAALAAERLAVGTNGLIGRATWDKWHTAGGVSITAERMHSDGITAGREAIGGLIALGHGLAITIDMRVIDTGHASGTPGVNVGGLTPMLLLDLLRDLVPLGCLRSIHIANLEPEADPRGHSEQLAAEVLLILLRDVLFEAMS